MNNTISWIPLPYAWLRRAWDAPGSVLLESTKPDEENHFSLLFTSPLRYLTAWSTQDLPWLFHAMQEALNSGYYLAGYFTYESGVALHGLPSHALPQGNPLIRLGVYRQPERFDHVSGEPQSSAGRDEADFDAGPIRMAMLPTVSPGAYEESIKRIQNLIGQGDTYQVNFTIPFQSRLDGSGLEAYRRLSREQPCSYGALLRMDEDSTVLSFSPELFFSTTRDGRITTRPMKGTARAVEGVPQNETVHALQHDEKNRAEHVMIVDLLRNDLGRVCEMGSVHVNGLFQVESYPTVHQMVSMVCGQLRKGISWREIFAALFPSGSITGAPKRRTMQIIHEMEARPRGIYTGAIGYIAPSGESAFSVAIRTLTLRDSTGEMAMATGGGIVADSLATEEWKECLLKASFVHRGCEELHLIETMLIDGSPHAVHRLPLHMERLTRSAHALGFAIDEEQVLHAMMETYHTWNARPMRIRLTLSRSGSVEITTAPLQPWPQGLRVRIAEDRTSPADPSLRHKTTFRHLYDDAFQAARRDGWDECLFLNTRDELTEGCITNLVVASYGELRTPALSCGVLPGVYRMNMIDKGVVQEAVLSLGDLVEADAAFLCNSVRGLVPVRSVQISDGKIVCFDPKRASDLRSSILPTLERSPN